MCHIVDFIDEHLRQLILCPKACILPQADWPEVAPQAKVQELDVPSFPSPVMERFVKKGELRGLPLNEGKAIVRLLTSIVWAAS